MNRYFSVHVIVVVALAAVTSLPLQPADDATAAIALNPVLLETQYYLLFIIYYQKMSDKLTVTDYYILKQLVYNPRMEISEIGKAISASSRTVQRRIEKMYERNHILEFTMLPNPDAMRGQIIFFISVKVEKLIYNEILEKIYSQLQNYIILSLMTYDQEKESIGMTVATEDVFKIESIRSQIHSLNGVKEANVFLPIKIQYNESVIMKAIERQIKKINVELK